MEKKMHEVWSHWEPFQKNKKEYLFNSIFENQHGDLIIKIVEAQNTKSGFEMIFKSQIKAYRKTYETHRIETFLYLNKKYKSKFYVQHHFFKIENSAFIQSFVVDTKKKMDFLRLQHFVFVDTHSFIDIIALDEPKINYFNLEN